MQALALAQQSLGEVAGQGCSGESLLLFGLRLKESNFGDAPPPPRGAARAGVAKDAQERGQQP